mmetsp:Transcript_58539/g.137519  ORF Transcript_58539/g.137519 Transcript_58539/m.137519 type:complete len:668 (-) Transcript_58539:237-2240(-)
MATHAMKGTAQRLLWAAAMLAFLGLSSGFYLPGVAPRKYRYGEKMMVKVNTMTSENTPLQFDYYNIDFCQPPGGEVELSENLGEVLAGERTETSSYVLHANVTKLCKVACRKKWTKKSVKEFRDFAGAGFRANMRLDNLPGAELVVFRDQNGEEFISYRLGYPIAEQSGTNASRLYINNHLRITIRYHDVNTQGTRLERIEEPGALIVGFELKAMSVKHRWSGMWNDTCAKENTCQLLTCDPQTGVVPGTDPLRLQNKKDMQVLFTYDVIWVHSDVKWASRWDVYLQMQWQDDEIHWFSIVNSSVILIFLTGMVAMIMLRILRKDLYKYNQLETSEEAREEAREETGWKLISGDVFRPPKHAALLAVFIGSGVQVLGMTMFTIGFAVLGFLSPSNRGSLLISMLLLFVLMGMPAGYVSAVFCKMFKGAGTDRLRNTLMTATLFPGVIFTIFFFLNLVLWGDRSTGAVPFSTLIAILMFWFGLSLPLVFFGSFLGFRRDAVEAPVRTNPIPRQVPEQVWYMKTLPSVMMAGVLPFGVVFVELFFILSSIWQHRFYYLFGFMGLVLLILIVTCAEITIVMCYFQLCSEDYHWWWRAYFTAGTSAVYFFLYAGYYVMTRMNGMETAWVSGCIFFGYIAGLSYAFFVLTGFTGFISCFFFVRCIYASIKVD